MPYSKPKRRRIYWSAISFRQSRLKAISEVLYIYSGRLSSLIDNFPASRSSERFWAASAALAADWRTLSRLAWVAEVTSIGRSAPCLRPFLSNKNSLWHLRSCRFASPYSWGDKCLARESIYKHTPACKRTITLFQVIGLNTPRGIAKREIGKGIE